MTTNTIKFLLSHPDAKLPVKGSAGAAGFDVCACESKTIPARGKALINTGVKYQLPSTSELSLGNLPVGIYLRVAPRSGLAHKHALDVLGGVCDCDYLGTIGVILQNHSDVDFVVNVGDRIAQIIPELILNLPVEQVMEIHSTE